jgi:hypothetical protein
VSKRASNETEPRLSVIVLSQTGTVDPDINVILPVLSSAALFSRSLYALLEAPPK